MPDFYIQYDRYHALFRPLTGRAKIFAWDYLAEQGTGATTRAGALEVEVDGYFRRLCMAITSAGMSFKVVI